MSFVRAVTTEDFAQDVLASPVPVVVDFYATWCPPCRMLAPVLDRAAEAFDGRVKVVKVNVDEEPELAARFGVSGVPTLAFVRGGRVVDQVVGVPDPQTLVAKFDRLATADRPAPRFG